MNGGRIGDRDPGQRLGSALGLIEPEPRDLAELERMARRRTGSDEELQAYCDGLPTRPSERELLLSELTYARAARAAEDLTVAALEQVALPTLVLGHAISGDARIRIWAPDASLLMPYRAAVSLLELLDGSKGSYSFKVIVTGRTDEAERSLGPWDIIGSEGRLDRYFHRMQGRYLPVPELANTLEFFPENSRRLPAGVDLVIIPPLPGKAGSARTISRYCRCLKPGSMLISPAPLPVLNLPDGNLIRTTNDDSLYTWLVEGSDKRADNH